MKSISVDDAVALLREGEVVALPTETVYGLAGSIFQEKALEKIFETKGRPFFDPLIVHVLATSDAKRVCVGFNDLHSALAEHYWPGPLTLVGLRSPVVSDLITAGLSTVAVRSPRHNVFREVLTSLGEPLAAPSANMFKKTSPTLAEHVVEEFQGRVPVVEGGPCEEGIESTIVEPSWASDKKKIFLRVYRPGTLSVQEIANFLQSRYKVPVEILRSTPEKEKQAGHFFAPGEMSDHYQPRKPLLLGLGPEEEVHNWVRRLGYKQPQRVDLPSSIQLAARGLYSALRQGLSEADCLLLLKPIWWDDPLAEGLRDRLIKASSKIFGEDEVT